MKAPYILLLVIAAILGLFLLLLLSKVRFRLYYEKDAFRVRMRYLFFFLSLYPRKIKPLKTGTEAPPTEQPPQEAPPKKKRDIKYLITLLLEMLRAFREKFQGKIRITIKRLSLTVGGKDAAATAILYGIVQQSVAYLYGFLDANFALKKKESERIIIKPNFTGSDSEFSADLTVSVSVFQGVRLLLSLLKASARAKKKRSSPPATKEEAKKTETPEQ